MTKFSKLAIGALIAAGLSPAAFALPQGATLDAIVGTNHEFFITGATASDGIVKAFVKNDLCAAGTYDLYQDISGTVKGGNWFVMTCTLNSASPVPASLFGANVIIHKRTRIGAIYGSYPIALNSYVEFMNIKGDRASGLCAADTAANTFNCAVAASNTVARDLPRHASNIDECDYQTAAPANPVAPAAGLDTLCRRGDVGTSDVESEMFQGVNLPNNSGDNMVKLTSTQLNGMVRTRAFGQLFGVAVSNGVWSALQAAQGLSGTPAADGSNWPSLSRDLIRQILTGNAANWNAAIGGATFAGSLNNLAICRREQGSGTQASSNQFFLNYPCDTTLAPAQDNTVGWSGGLWVKENTSSTFVKACLNDVETGGANANSGNPAGGIGVLSFNGNPGGSDTWKWLRIDGLVPSMQNAVLGKSDFWYETQIAYSKTLAAGTELDFAKALQSEMGKATRITAAAANGLAAMPFTATVGVFDQTSPVVNNSAFPSIYTATNPVMGGKHGSVNTFPTSGSPLSCRAIILSSDTPASGVDRVQ